jgi:hypothetical protein
LGLAFGIAEELPGDGDLDFDLDFDLDMLFAGGVRLLGVALDVPLDLVLPLEGLGLNEAISFVGVFFYPFLWFFVLFRALPKDQLTIKFQIQHNQQCRRAWK